MRTAMRAECDQFTCPSKVVGQALDRHPEDVSHLGRASGMVEAEDADRYALARRGIERQTQIDQRRCAGPIGSGGQTIAHPIADLGKHVGKTVGADVLGAFDDPGGHVFAAPRDESLDLRARHQMVVPAVNDEERPVEPLSKRLERQYVCNRGERLVRSQAEGPAEGRRGRVRQPCKDVRVVKAAQGHTCGNAGVERGGAGGEVPAEAHAETHRCRVPPPNQIEQRSDGGVECGKQRRGAITLPLAGASTASTFRPRARNRSPNR